MGALYQTCAQHQFCNIRWRLAMALQKQVVFNAKFGHPAPNGLDVSPSVRQPSS